MKSPDNIHAALTTILSQKNLPRRLHSTAHRYRAGKLGLEAMVSLLEGDGWTVEITIFKPAPAKVGAQTEIK